MAKFVPINVVIRPSRFDLTGQHCSVDDLAALLNKVPRSLATVSITTLCNLLVEEEPESAFKVDQIARAALLRTDLRQKLDRFQSGQRRVLAFQRAQLLIGLQLAQRLCVDDEAGLLDRQEALYSLGEALLGVSEFFDRGVAAKIADKDGKSAAAAFLPMHERSNPPKTRLALRRTYEMLGHPLWSEDSRLAEAALRFETRMGVSPRNYMLVILGLAVKVMSKREFGPDNRIRLATVFSQARDRDSIRRIVESISIGYRELPTLIAAPDAVLRDLPVEPFRSTPLIAVHRDQFWCADLFLLTQRMLSGLFWTLMEATPVDQRPALTAAWGDLFEKYMTSRLAPAFGKRYRPDPRDPDGNQITDGIVVEKPDLILLEFKAPLLRDDVKRSLAIDSLREEFAKKFLKNAQLGRAAERLCSEEELRKSLNLGRRIETIYPVIVSLDFAAGAPLLAEAMDEPFREATRNLTLKGATLAPLSVLTADDAETLLPFVEAGKKLRNMLRESVEKNPERQPTFHNYLVDLTSRMAVRDPVTTDDLREPFEAMKAFWRDQWSGDLFATM